MLYKVKLLTSYKNAQVGSIYETDKEKATQLVELKRAEWVSSPRQQEKEAHRAEAAEAAAKIAAEAKVMSPKVGRRGYKTK